MIQVASQPARLMVRRSTLHRRGSVIVIVLWAIAITALVASSIQLLGFRQAALGREAVGRIQARWAARAGVQATINEIIRNTQEPIPDDAYAIIRDMEAVAAGDLSDASWDIRHHRDGRDWAGPLDEHSRINLNQSQPGSLRVLMAEFDNIGQDFIDAIEDWQDKDDQPRGEGAERDYYANLPNSMEPRNGPMRTVGEVELVAGVKSRDMRNEDYNLNNRLDPSEDDGGLTWPTYDQPDGILDVGWAGQLTVHSRGNGATASGLPRLRLGLAKPSELMERLGVDQTQANQLIQFGLNQSARMEQLFSSQPQGSTGSANPASSGRNNRNSRGGAQQPANQQGQLPTLSDEQLAKVFLETMLEGEHAVVPGKINLNTVSADLLRDIMKNLMGDDSLADEIIYLRNSQSGGIVSLLDLMKIPSFVRLGGRARLELLGRFFDTQSNVYTITSRGRSWSTGLEVEIIAVVDRSILPVRILEYREQ